MIGNHLGNHPETDPGTTDRNHQPDTPSTSGYHLLEPPGTTNPAMEGGSPVFRPEPPQARYHRGDPADLIESPRSFLAGLTPSWHRDAACIDRGDADWFSRRAGDIEVTVAICGECPVMTTCRREAIERGENYGVWGGLDEQALRAAVKLHRKRGDHA